MNASLGKGIFLGAAVGALTLLSTAAFAGSGVGGVFNLGKTNPVNAKTELSGSTNDQQLRIANSNTGSHATGVGIQVATGRPPLVIGSSTKVTHLNADFVDGLHSSSLQRVVAKQCDHGESISYIHANGADGCARSAILALDADVPNGQYRLLGAFDPTAPTLRVYAHCHDGKTAIDFYNAGSDAAPLNFVFNGGTFFAGGTSLAPLATQTFNFLNGRLEGQWIFSDSGAVITVKLHAYDGGFLCQVRGTGVAAYLT
jgi:hypothetical protein